MGREYEGTVKAIRPDKQVDIILGRVGRAASDMNSQKILDFIKKSNGKTTLTDKSTPEEISNALGMSKKSFKNGRFIYRSFT